MIPAIFWKEWREQRTIALAVLAFGVPGARASTAQFADPTAGGVVDVAGRGPRADAAVACLPGRRRLWCSPPGR